MRIALDIRSLGKKRTGDEVYIQKIVDAMKNDSIYLNQYILFTDNPQWHEMTELQELPDSIQVVCLLPANKLLWTMYLLPKACHKYNIDILHVMYITPLWGLPEKTKLITTIHDISWKFVPEFIQWKDRLILNIFIPLATRRSDLILTVSKHAAESIHHIYHTPRSKVKAIYNGGFLVDDIKSSIKLSKNVHNHLGDSYILYLGSLQPRKNIPVLINAFQKYVQEHQESKLKLIIAGGKGYNYDSLIEETISKHKLQDRVIQIGFVSDSEKFALIKNCKAFFFLSLYEGFGIPAIEAMSLKKITVVSDRSCLPEVVDNGALIVNPDDIDQVVKAIYKSEYPGKIEKELVELGFERSNIFQWKNMQEAILKTYQKM